MDNHDTTSSTIPAKEQAPASIEEMGPQHSRATVGIECQFEVLETHDRSFEKNDLQ